MSDELKISEIITERTKNSKIYNLNNNIKRLEISLGDCHYLDKNNIWQEIDNKLENEINFGQKIKKATYNLRITEEFIRFGFSECVYVDYIFDLKNAVFNEYGFTISDFDKNTDIKYTTRNESIKSEIILNKPGHPNSFTFSINTVGCKPKLENNSLVFYNGENIVGSIPSPYVIDSNDNRGEVILDYKEDNIIFKIDEKWLENAIYPIIVDPTTTLQVGAGANDGYVDKSAGTYFNSNQAHIDICDYSSSDEQYSMFLLFTSINIPQGAEISSAKLQLRANMDASDTTGKVKLYANDVDDATTVTSHADFYGRTLTTAYATWNVTTAMTSGSWYDSSDITSVIQEVIDRVGWVSGNDILIQSIDNGGTYGHRRFSSYDENSSYAPKLVVEYVSDQTLSLSTISSNSILGTLTLTGIVNLSLTSISSGSTIGAVTLSPGATTLLLSDVETTVSLGSINIFGEVTLSLNSISLTSTLGDINYIPGEAILSLSSVTSGETLGTLILSGTLNLSSILSNESLGSILFLSGETTLSLSDISSTEILGIISFDSAVSLSISSVESGEVLGSITILPGEVNLNLNSIASTLNLSDIDLIPGDVTLSLTEISSGLSLGLITFDSTVTLSLNSIASSSDIETIILVPGSVAILPDSISSTELLGSPILSNILMLSSVSSSEILNIPVFIPGEATLSLFGISSGNSISIIDFNTIVTLSLNEIISSSVVNDVVIIGNVYLVTKQNYESSVVDTTVNNINPSMSYANYPYLNTGRDSSGVKWRLFLKPDFSGIPYNCTLLRSEVRLKVYQSGNGIFNLHECTESWSENISWNSQPDYLSLYDQYNLNVVVSEWVTFNVLGLMCDWLTNAKNNNGILIKGNNESINQYVSFYSSSYLVSSYRPIFYFEYVQGGKRKCLFVRESFRGNILI